ncbi:MAG TPA: tRNA pseudouridine(55) synthase TruB [Steroidobacteraceae bacterium]
MSARALSACATGILLLDKPVGMSSNAALQRVRRLAGGVRAGHCGSLDPLASGMLPICLGEATRLAGELLAGRKSYAFGLLLGERSATGDGEGEIVERCPVPALSAAAVIAALEAFRGPQMQVPPMYSALKREGTPLYRLARSGITVARQPRAIHIDTLRLLALEGAQLELEVLCSKGTYVRVLAEEIARALGSCGRLFSLRRNYVEPFDGAPMARLEQLEASGSGPQAWPVLPADRAVGHLPAMHLQAAEAQALAHGRVVAMPQAAVGRWRLYDEQGRFLGLGVTSATRELRVQRLFSAPLAV